MLVLTRKLGEKIRINDDVTVSIVELDGKHVKLGVDAPKSISIHREEVYLRIQEENKMAASSQHQKFQDLAKILKEKNNPS